VASAAHRFFIFGNPKDTVVGICVGSVRSELIDYERIEVDGHGNKLKESRVKIEEYGLAHDIVSLNSWRPQLLGREIIARCVACRGDH